MLWSDGAACSNWSSPWFTFLEHLWYLLKNIITHTGAYLRSTSTHGMPHKTSTSWSTYWEHHRKYIFAVLHTNAASDFTVGLRAKRPRCCSTKQTKESNCIPFNQKRLVLHGRILKKKFVYMYLKRSKTFELNMDEGVAHRPSWFQCRKQYFFSQFN